MSEQNTSPTKAYDWAALLKADVGEQAGGGETSRSPIPVGKHSARISAIKFQTFKKGSYGVQLTYGFEGGAISGRTINEYIVLVTKEGVKTDYGDLNLKRRLMAVLTAAQLKNFKQPKSEQDLGDFRLLFNAPVTLNIKEADAWEGRPQRKVAGVYSRSDE